MSYTGLESHHINHQDPILEAKILECFRRFCYKSPPLPFLKGRTIKETDSEILSYFEENFRDNLCFHDKNVKGFAVFGEGQKWLDESIPEFEGRKIAVLIMGASQNENLGEARLALTILNESFRRLKEVLKYDVVAWNQNREHKQKGFERIMKLLGAKKIKTCYFV
jgi:hypothetical protein